MLLNVRFPTIRDVTWLVTLHEPATRDLIFTETCVSGDLRPGTEDWGLGIGP